MQLSAAFLLGFLGSFHCVGMCGPILMALPQSQEKNSIRFWKQILYHSGRISVYFIFGLFVGLIGKGLLIIQIQQSVSIVFGLILLLLTLFPILLPSKVSTFTFFKFQWFKKLFAKLINSKKTAAIYFLGFLNGLLPCGFVYVALAAAVITASPLNAAGFMAFFGLGTAPALIILTMLGAVIQVSVRNKLRKTLPIITIIVALLLILRGLNLGIPMLSPKINMQHSEPSLNCCQHP
jgi:sulfite exporter TauE/SafE